MAARMIQSTMSSAGASAVWRSVRTGAFAQATDQINPPPAQKVKIALCQIMTGEDKQENVAVMKQAVEKAAGTGAQLVVLPEMWNCPYANSSFPVYAEDLAEGSSASADAMSAIAKQYNVTLVGGSIPERSSGKLYNTCLVFDNQGQLLARHRKLHLFDIDIPGKITFRESDTLTPGTSLTVVDTPVGRLGIGICYDIRFPELAMLYAARGVQLIVYPGAFNMTTGPVHWQLLQQARAVDNQLFVCTCSPARNPAAQYQAWGHSTVVGPFGEVLATTEHEPDVLIADLDFADLEQRRANMQLSKQKRHDLYRLLDISRDIDITGDESMNGQV